MICGANGTQDGVIRSSLSGAHKCAMPAATKNTARTQRMIARAKQERSEFIRAFADQKMRPKIS
jgi:hypothetical protein